MDLNVDIYLKWYLTRHCVRQIQSYISNIICRTSETRKDTSKISASTKAVYVWETLRSTTAII